MNQGSLSGRTDRRRLLRSLALLAAAAAVCCAKTGAPPSSPLHVRITGDEYHWIATYPGADGRLGTSDDAESRDEIRVPERRPVRIELASRDFVYRLALPDLDVNQVAVPDLLFDVSLEPLRRGSYPLVGDQFCGFSHDSLMGRLIVDGGAEFEDWVRALPTGGAAEGEDERSRS